MTRELRSYLDGNSAHRVLPLLLGILILAGPGVVWAHQDPPTCNGVGAGISIFPFFALCTNADKTCKVDSDCPGGAPGVCGRPVGNSEINDCAQLLFKAQLAYQPGN